MFLVAFVSLGGGQTLEDWLYRSEPTGPLRSPVRGVCVSPIPATDSMTDASLRLSKSIATICQQLHEKKLIHGDASKLRKYIVKGETQLCWVTRALCGIDDNAGAKILPLAAFPIIKLLMRHRMTESMTIGLRLRPLPHRSVST